MSAEIWEDIAGYEGLYQISNRGNVMSLNYRRTKRSRLLTPKKNNKGYLWVELRNGSKTPPKQMLINRLVALAFVSTEDESLLVNHKDKNPLNNAVDNLEWRGYPYKGSIH